MQWPGFAKKKLQLFSANYKILLILGDFQVEFDRTCMNAFYDSPFKSLVKKTYFFQKSRKWLLSQFDVNEFS